MKIAYKLVLLRLFHAKAWAIPLAFSILVFFLSPFLVSWREFAPWLGMTYSQAALFAIWFCALGYGIVAASNVGHEFTAFNHRLLFKSARISDLHLYLGSSLAVLTFILPHAFAFHLLSLGFGFRNMGTGAWIILHAQSFLLFAAVASGLIPLAIGFAGRFGNVSGIVAALVPILSGTLGAHALEQMRSTTNAGAQLFAEILFSLIPHLRLADLGERIVHQWGPLGGGFPWTLAYLSAWTLIFFGAGLLCWKKRWY